jgi:outer membrane protein assembly factor BamA
LDSFPRNSLELKTYFTKYSKNSYFSGNNFAARLKFTRYLTKDLHFSSFAWKGQKRLSYESDKGYSFNALDEYTSGFGLEVGYNIGESFELKLGYAVNSVKPYEQPGTTTYAGQWTLGLTTKD